MSKTLHPNDFPSWDEYYFRYQRELASLALLPALRDWGLWREGLQVLDIGCGLGGASFEIADRGAEVDAVEIDARLAAAATERRAERMRVVHADITEPSTLGELREDYDLALYRDVLEHIPEADAALAETVRRLRAGGSLVLIFPPWYSPYGGHQQTLPARRTLGIAWGKLPFAHWLPPSWHRALARMGSEEEAWRELETIRRAHLTLRSMDRLAERHGLRRRFAKHYLSRPSYALRYGLPIVDLDWMGQIPVLREVIVTGSYQCFEKLG